MAYLTRQQAIDIINKAPANLNKDTLLMELGKTNTIEGYNDTQKKSGVLQNIGREIIKPFAQGAEIVGQGTQAFGSVLKAGTQVLSGNKEAAKKTLSSAANKIQTERAKPLTVLGEDVGRINSMKQSLGTGLNVVSNFVGGGGVAKAGNIALKTGLKSSILTGVKTGAKAGALYGAGTALSEDKNVLVGAATGALGGAIVGGALPAVGSAVVGTVKTLVSPFTTAIEKIVPALNKVANKVETVVTKPSKTDLAHGFKVENIFKYDLGGPLGTSLEKTQATIDGLVAKAELLRGKSKSVIDLNTIVKDVADELDKGSISTVGNNAKILNAFKTWITELENIAPSGKINTVDAQKIKVALGKMGSWLNGQRDLDSTAMENVSNIFYTKFKTAIENAVDDPAELKAINQQLSELIPINNVLIKRIPIAERNSALSLTDIISGAAGTLDPKAWGVFAVNRLSKSGRFANLVNKASKKLESGATKLLPLETKLKNIKPGLTIEDVSKTPLKSNPLIQEAKKYKSAEEFVKRKNLNPTEIGSLTKKELESGISNKLGKLENLRLDKQDTGTQLDALTSIKDGGSKYDNFTVYRVVPKGKEIGVGDFVFDNKKMAEEYLLKYGKLRNLSEIKTLNNIKAEDLLIAGKKNQYGEITPQKGEFIYIPK